YTTHLCIRLSQCARLI
ncbi:unnamed protein product, partial [Leptidea sinapis]